METARLDAEHLEVHTPYRPYITIIPTLSFTSVLLMLPIAIINDMIGIGRSYDCTKEKTNTQT
jgi:hypothetical protein